MLPGSLVNQSPLEGVTFVQLQLLLLRSRKLLQLLLHPGEEDLLLLRDDDIRVEMFPSGQTLPPQSLLLLQTLPQFVQLAGPHVADTVTEQFVEIKLLVHQKINARGLTEKSWIWSISRGGPGPDIEVVAAVLVAVGRLVVVEGTKSKLDQQKLPA